MQALSDDDDNDDNDDDFDASRYTASFGVEVGSDDDDGGDAADGATTRAPTEPLPATELPPVLIEEEDGPGTSDEHNQPEPSPPAETASDPYFGPAASSSTNSIVAAVSQKQAEVAVISASQAVSSAAVQEAHVGNNTTRRKAVVSDDEEEDRTAQSAEPAAAKARGKKVRAPPKASHARRQQESAPVQAAAVVDTKFLETLNVAVKNKRLKDTGLQLCDFKKFLTRWTPSRLEFELPSNITREAAPWAVENADGRLRIPPVPMDFDVFYTYGLRKEADDIIKNAKDNDVDLLRHCAAATITCFRAEENNTYSTVAFLRVALVEPKADADSEIAEAWTLFRDRAYRKSDGLSKYEILIVLNPIAFGILKNDREITGMFFAEGVHAVAQKGGRGSTANHYNQKFETLLQDCEFDEDFCIIAKNTKAGKKRPTSSKSAGSNEPNKQKKSSSQPTIMAAIGLETAVTMPEVEQSEEDESGEEDTGNAGDDAGAGESSTAIALLVDNQVAAPMHEDRGDGDFNLQRVNAGVYFLGPENSVSTCVRNGNVYATVFA